jgi:hypothetical protein
MSRAISSDKVNGAKKVEGYKPPEAPKKLDPNDPALNEISNLLKNLPFLISAAIKDPPEINVPAPVVHVDAAKAPDVKVNSPVYVNPPEIKIPATVVNVPENKAPIVNIEPAAVTLQTNRPKEWEFSFSRNEYGQITTVRARAI